MDKQEAPARIQGPPAGSLSDRSRSRRRFLVASGALVAAAGTGAIVAGVVGSAGPDAPGPALAEAGAAASPIRPPAVPLAVRGPYLSTWLPATELPGTWPAFWTGSPTGMAGIVRVDKVSYTFAGAPETGQALRQSLLEVTPTRSVFHLEGGGITLVVEFLSPVEPGNPQAQSIPLSYVLVTAQSADGKPHDVQLYLDISGDWATGGGPGSVSWAPAQVNAPNGDLQVWTVQASHQQPFTEQGQMAAWGTVIWATPLTSGLTSQAGRDVDVRGGFLRRGYLAGGAGAEQHAGSRDRPVFAFSVDLGRLPAAPVTVPLFIGHVRTPALRYLGQDLESLWTTYFPAWPEMLSFFAADVAQARQRADTLDAQITADATAAGGTAYAGLCAIALRQAYGGTELVASPDGKPWAFLKEISSDGNVSTVDVIYPASPAWLYADPAYLAMLLEPVFTYAESGGWPKPYAEHDLGLTYPNATGHNNGVEEDMPVEESGNMLIMAAACLKREPAMAAAFVTAHYDTLKKWADYLVSVLPDPGYQNQTDDFAGLIAHSVNLALKGIIAVAAMGQIAAAAGNGADQSHYTAMARQYLSFWLRHSSDPGRQHLDLTYSGRDGGNGSWGTLYNAYADKLLGTSLVPAAVQAEQAAWYTRKMEQFGLPLQVPHIYAKSDWEMFTAAWLSDYPIKNELIRRVYAYASTTPSRVPFGDLYNANSGEVMYFQARPVQGGMFALLALGSQGAVSA
jgi:hypothetical protein